MSRNTIKIRKARAQDARPLTRIVKETLLSSNSPHYPELVISRFIGYYSEKNLGRHIKERLVFAATFNGRFAGTAQLDSDGWVYGMYIRKKYQGFGIGRRLIWRIRAAARRRGLSTLRAHASLNSVDFYKKLGFRAIRKVKLEEVSQVCLMVAKL